MKWIDDLMVSAESRSSEDWEQQDDVENITFCARKLRSDPNGARKKEDALAKKVKEIAAKSEELEKQIAKEKDTDKRRRLFLRQRQLAEIQSGDSVGITKVRR